MRGRSPPVVTGGLRCSPTSAGLSADLSCVAQTRGPDGPDIGPRRRQRMRRSFWLAAAGGLSLSVGAAARPPADSAPTAPGAAAVQPAQAAPPWANKFFLPDIATNREQPAPLAITHNFGEVPHGTLCVQKFIITNIYDVPMQITDVRKSCTCLDYIPLTKTLQPNETAEFTVTMNAGKFVGLNTQTFYVTFGPKYVSTAVIRVQATSRTDVTLTPGAVAFGTVPQGSRSSQAVTVKYSGRTRDWKLTEVVPTQGPFEVRFAEVSRGGVLRGGAEYSVEVTLKPNAPPGAISEQVGIKTSDPTHPVVQIAVSGTIAAPIELAPNKVRFDGVPVGQSVTQRVLVRAAKPFKILGVDGAGDGVTVELPSTPAPLQVHFLTVKFDPKQAGVASPQLRIRTDLDGGSATLPIEAEAIAK
ncbi:MAG: hypothetical protein C0467_00760 [Planctomycetaceae bacterium]|nr:hypothetical protein [Planctomycetaceae bacterium]